MADANNGVECCVISMNSVQVIESCLLVNCTHWETDILGKHEQGELIALSARLTMPQMR